MPPILANYYLTYKCNSRCTYCDIPTKPENIPIRETSPEVIIENLAALKRLGVKVVDFTGGEPLIYKHLPQVLRAAKEMGFFTSLANTGKSVSSDGQRDSRIGRRSQILALDNRSAAYKSERGIDGYTKVIESIKLAKSLGEQPSIIATATPESIWGMEKVIRLAQELGVVVLLGPVFDYSSVDNDLLHQKGITELQRLAKLDNVCVNWAFLQFYLDGGNQIKKPRCKAISSVVVVSPDDHLLLPCYHMHDERLKIQHEQGRSNLDEMWHSLHVQKRRKEEGSWSFCQGCTIWCYFETSFLWPPDKYFLLNLQSKGRWAKEKIKQLVESKTGLNITRRLPGASEKELVNISTNPVSEQTADLVAPADSSASSSCGAAAKVSPEGSSGSAACSTKTTGESATACAPGLSVSAPASETAQSSSESLL